METLEFGGPRPDIEEAVIDFEAGPIDPYPKTYELAHGRAIVLGESEVREFTALGNPRQKPPQRFLRVLVIREYGGKREIRVKADDFEDWLFERR